METTQEHFVDDPVTAHVDEAFSMLCDHMREAQHHPHADLRDVTVHHWIMSLGVQLRQAGLAVCSLARNGHGKAALVATRSATECTVRIPFFMEKENRDKACVLMIVEPLERQRAKSHMGALKANQQQALAADLATARLLFRAMRPNLQKASDEDVDEAMSKVRFPDMAFLIKRYFNDSKEYVVRYMWQSGIEHGGFMAVRQAIDEANVDGSVRLNFELSDRQENNVCLMMASYAIVVSFWISKFYDLKQHHDYDAVVERHFELKKVYDPMYAAIEG